MEQIMILKYVMAKNADLTFFLSYSFSGWPGLNCIQGVTGPPSSLTDLQFNQSSSSSNLIGGNYDRLFQGICSDPNAVLATAPSNSGAVTNTIPETQSDSSEGENVTSNLEVAIYYCLATKLFYSYNN